MGIRCHCPNGHRLNIKTFLAGKRGICPDCGARFTIPKQSDPSLPQKSTSGSDSQPHVAPNDLDRKPYAGESSEAAKDEAVGQFVGPTDEELRLVKGLPDDAEDSVTGIRATTASVSHAAPDSHTAPVSHGKAATNQDAQPVPEDAGNEPLDAANTASPSKGFADSPTQLESPSAALDSAVTTVAPDLELNASAPIAAAAQAQVPTARPIVESGNTSASSSPAARTTDTDEGGADQDAEWFVQIADGQRFGPADTQMMHVWISDGRVAPDNLVHQRGWPSWKTAAEVFPSLAPASRSEPVADANELVFDGGLRTDKYRGRAAAKSRLFAVVAALGVTSVVLLAALIYVVRS